MCTSSKFEIFYKTVIYHFVYCVKPDVVDSSENTLYVLINFKQISFILMITMQKNFSVKKVFAHLLYQVCIYLYMYRDFPQVTSHFRN